MLRFLSSLPKAGTSLAGSPAPLHCFGSPSGKEVEARPPGHTQQFLLAAYSKYLGQKPSGSTQIGLSPVQEKTHMPASGVLSLCAGPFLTLQVLAGMGCDLRPKRVSLCSFPLESAGRVRPRAPRCPNTTSTIGAFALLTPACDGLLCFSASGAESKPMQIKKSKKPWGFPAREKRHTPCSKPKPRLLNSCTPLPNRQNKIATLSEKMWVWLLTS